MRVAFYCDFIEIVAFLQIVASRRGRRATSDANWLIKRLRGCRVKCPWSGSYQANTEKLQDTRLYKCFRVHRKCLNLKQGIWNKEFELLNL